MQPQVPLLFSGQRRWAPPGERKASCLALGSWLPIPRLVLPDPCFTIALSLSCTPYFWASMMSSGSPLPLLFLTSGPSAWQLFTAGSSFPQKS